MNIESLYNDFHDLKYTVISDIYSYVKQNNEEIDLSGYNYHRLSDDQEDVYYCMLHCLWIKDYEIYINMFVGRGFYACEVEEQTIPLNELTADELYEVIIAIDEKYNEQFNQMKENETNAN